MTKVGEISMTIDSVVRPESGHLTQICNRSWKYLVAERQMEFFFGPVQRHK